MKKNHGSPMRQFILLIVIAAACFAGDFSYTFTLSTRTPYVKEAVIMKLDLVQTDHSKVLLFKFSPKKSDDYEFYRLGMKEEDAYHAAKIHYTYLIYPKKPGKIKIDFDLIEMVTTDEKVAYSFSGDRDNIRGLNKTDIPIDLPPLELRVKALPEGTDLVGDFTLHYSIKKKHAQSFEPLPVTITIEGEGYPPVLSRIIPESKHYTIFSEKPIVQSSKSEKGNKSRVVYSFALSAREDFDLPEIILKAFNPQTRHSYELKIPRQHFRITRPKPEELVDKVDAPRPLQSDWSWLGTLLGYLIAFGAGFLTAKSLKWKRSKGTDNDTPAIESDIEAIDDPKTLLALLAATDSKRFQKQIEALEKKIYGKKGRSLKQIKQDIYHIIREDTL